MLYIVLFIGEVILIIGGFVSGVGNVVAVLLTHVVFMLPEVSTVRVLMVYWVSGVREVALKKAVEVLVWWMLFR